MNEAMTAYDEAFLMAEMSYQLNDASGLIWAFHMIDAAEYMIADLIDEG